MKATITQDGTLVLTPESSLEGYALKHWVGCERAIYAKPWEEIPMPATGGAMAKSRTQQEQTQ